MEVAGPGLGPIMLCEDPGDSPEPSTAPGDGPEPGVPPNAGSGVDMPALQVYIYVNHKTESIL